MTKALTGDPQVLEALNIALKGELTAINQYFLHARMLDDWGFAKRGQDEYKESIEEMGHADKLIKRILLLGGLPNLQDLGKLYIGENLKEVIECDYRLELEGIAHYRKAIGICEAAKDYVSRDLLGRDPRGRGGAPGPQPDRAGADRQDRDREFRPKPDLSQPRWLRPSPRSWRPPRPDMGSRAWRHGSRCRGARPSCGPCPTTATCRKCRCGSSAPA